VLLLLLLHFTKEEKTEKVPLLDKRIEGWAT
jgi:hypothetical protein